MAETHRLLGALRSKERPGARTPELVGLYGSKTMSTKDLSGQESDGRTDPQPAHRNELADAASEKTLKRARWEHLRLAAVPGAKRVNVCNVSYGVQAKSEHTYTVTVERGEPTDCTSPATEYQPGSCKHAVAVADDREVLDEATGDSR